ncbi:MAG: serine--tRNA ligase [Alphaproteobacteria bacterium 16-39-46]|nr:MAG: serine--tRNA ligase [Rhodospirillales bacterium 35-44-4]OYZ36682.1 MAG: serine--tRNA ligase [Alphaproteobacteria bacterium 16-39-46]OZA42224.1 MAG: serine--tRNA ligase [Alphaproteobacteria bacterium 17-39-52]HQS84575.1 serine--tRNA ligase [Alphaproteobacteria bacterium]HQS94364.1 serine--tRNA ligase [Alphaproteobacteria bacterium]
MFDLKWIRDNQDVFDRGLHHRGLISQSTLLLEMDESLRALQTELQTINESRNAIARKMGELKQKGEDITPLVQEGSRLKNLLPTLEEKERALSQHLFEILAALPNLPQEDVPVGDGSANIELKQIGKIPFFSFTPKQHFELGEALGLMDFEQAAYISGSRFVILKGPLARLERALASFMLDIHTQEFGYQEVSPPLLVKDDALFGTGNLPKFSEDLFKTTSDHWLIPTGEVPLTNLVAQKILEADTLPLRFTAYTPCFRLEAGAAGRDTRGMLRQHQFGKVELVSITTPDQAASEHERMLTAAQTVLERLEIPYRIMLLASQDISPASQKTYDIEAWLPGQNCYREVSSCSLCGSYQARRMNARYRPEDSSHKKPVFVSTLNGSGVAVGRALIALLENHQQEDGSIKIPSALRPYLNNAEKISSHGTFL